MSQVWADAARSNAPPADLAGHGRRQTAQRMPAWWQVAAPMALSGLAGLAYQIVWTQQLGTWLGHEVGALLAVVAAFFGGLALGAWALGGRVSRSTRPGRWLAALEAVIALWALVLVLVMPAAGALLLGWIGDEASPWRQWGVAFVGTALLLLPATAAMGATLPAMQRVLAPLRGAGYAVGGLYAVNTAGALLGVLAAAFWLAPWLGLSATACVAAGLNLACAAMAWRWLAPLQRPAPADATLPGAAAPASAPARRSATLWALSACGLLGIGLQVVVVRVLSQTAENTVYTYAILLAVYLLGTAAGGALYQRSLASRRDSGNLRAALVAVVVLSVLGALLTLSFAPALKALLLPRPDAGFQAALWAEAGLGLAAFLLPTVAMGALFSHLAVQARDAGWALGPALAANTLGAALAAPLVGVLLLPRLGPAAVLVALAAGYLLLLPASAWRTARAWLPAAGVLGLAVLGPPLQHVQVPDGGRLLSHADGVLAAVSVVEDADGVRRLHINNREQEGSSATRLADARQAWLPLLLHPAPQQALFLGLGTGVTAASASAPGLVVEAVELLPEVVQAAALFVPALATPGVAGAPQVRVADARRHVRAGGPLHDVIVSDLFHPARSGSGALYTAEHFEAVRQRLAPGGLFCQWLPLHQLDLASLRSIVAAFLQAHPDAVALLATNSLDTPVIGLLGRAPGGAGPAWSADSLAARLAGARRLPALAGLQLDDPWAVPGSLLADATALRRFAGSAAANTDDHPTVAYLAPRLRNGTSDNPRTRLAQVLDGLQADAPAIFGPPADAAAAAWQQRLGAYWQARHQHLRNGMAVQPASSLQAMLAQVQAPLLATLQTSPDFRPAYDPLLRMALALHRDDPAAARRLLGSLQAAAPQRSEAAEALARLP